MSDHNEMNPDKQELATNDDPFTCCFGCIEVFHDFGCTVVEGQVDTHTFGGLSAHVERINGPFRAKISGYTGVGCFTGGTSIGPCDYAELFETIDAQPIDVGYFVTLEGEKIRKAHSKDHYILGITSATPGILGNSSDFEWRGKYLTDEWGRIQYKEVVIPAVMDGEGKVITPERKEKQPILNPNWESTTDYIPRSQRPEWVAVGLLGQLLIRDDGTCEVNGYCKPNDEGIATTSNAGYRVMKRTGPNQILVLVNI